MADDQELNENADSVLSQDQLDELLANGIKPHSKILADIIVRDEVAVVIYQLAPDDHEGNEEALALGWDRCSPVFELGAEVKTRLIENLEEDGDMVGARWFRGGRCGRIVVVTGYGTLLVNHDMESGYSIEGAALDRVERSGWAT